MNKKGQKLLTFTVLISAATGVIHCINRFIETSSQLKNLLPADKENIYKWRFGDISYTKEGSGSPVLLIHDMMPGLASFEWKEIKGKLSENHTVYTLDLLGCGCSDKPGITYTNFLYVQLINSFIKDIIKEKTDVIATGLSASFLTMACANDKDGIGKLIFINPPSISSLTKSPSEKDKMLKCFLEIPIIGTMIYNMIVSRETISTMFMEKLYYNPFHVRNELLDLYYESSHKKSYYAKFVYASHVSKFMNISITNAIHDLDNSIYIIEGDHETNGESITEVYKKINPSIEIVTVKDTKHFPHLENPKGTYETISIFLDSE